MMPMKRITPVEALGRMLGGATAGVLAHIVIGIAINLAVVVVSYHLFEMKFLRLKCLFAAH
jgi:hypothetical protein